MITEKYCNEILQQYPEYITKDQMYRICHISKKTCLFLLESGLVPNIDSGKKTRRFKIKTVDVIQYLKDRDDYPELFKAPDGFYKGKGGDKKAPSFDEVFTQEDLIRSQRTGSGFCCKSVGVLQPTLAAKQSSGTIAAHRGRGLPVFVDSRFFGFPPLHTSPPFLLPRLSEKRIYAKLFV